MKGGENMDRKELLLRLCQKLYDAVDYLYHEGDSGLQGHLGDRLIWFGNMLSKVGWILTWGEEEDKEKMFKMIEDAFKNSHMLKCNLEQWLYFKLQEVEDDIDRRMGRKEEEPNPELQQEEDELPF
jgi:hypothetical protein